MLRDPARRRPARAGPDALDELHRPQLPDAAARRPARPPGAELRRQQGGRDRAPERPRRRRRRASCPPGMPGYTSDVTGYPYDPERARALLREAGQGDGFTTELWTQGSDLDLKIGQKIQRDLSAGRRHHGDQAGRLELVPGGDPPAAARCRSSTSAGRPTFPTRATSSTCSSTRAAGTPTTTASTPTPSSIACSSTPGTLPDPAARNRDYLRRRAPAGRRRAGDPALPPDQLRDAAAARARLHDPSAPAGALHRGLARSRALSRAGAARAPAPARRRVRTAGPAANQCRQRPASSRKSSDEQRVPKRPACTQIAPSASGRRGSRRQRVVGDDRVQRVAEAGLVAIARERVAGGGEARVRAGDLGAGGIVDVEIAHQVQPARRAASGACRRRGSAPPRPRRGRRPAD